MRGVAAWREADAEVKMIHHREIQSSPAAAERAARHASIADGGRNRQAKPPWLADFQGRFTERLAVLEPHERERLFCLMVLESVRLRELHELGLLAPILAEREEKRAAERATA